MSDLFEIIALFLNDKSYQGQLSDIDANFQGNLFETIQDYLHKLLLNLFNSLFIFSPAQLTQILNEGNWAIILKIFLLSLW